MNKNNNDFFTNASGYLDTTCGFALRNVEKSERRKIRSKVLIDVISIQEDLQASLVKKGFEYIGNGKVKHIETKNVFKIKI